VELLNRFVSEINVGVSTDFENLRLTPLTLKQAEHRKERYISLDVALDEGVAEVREVSDSGSVGQVRVMNLSDRFLVLFDGDGLKGAKQNRIMEQTVVIAPKSDLIVPVNCVERGRWDYNSDRFGGADFKATPSVKKNKAALKKQGLDRNVQRSVWQSVDQSAMCLSVNSYSDDLGEIMERSGISTDLIEKYLSESTCHGYLVQGAGEPFIEIFPDASSAKTWAIKSAKGWIADTRFKPMKKYPVDVLLEALRISSWAPAKTVGSETAYQSSDAHDGRITYEDGNLLHLYTSFNLSH